jgi:hypothetical protein
MEKLAYETRYSVSNTTIFLSYSFSIKQRPVPQMSKHTCFPYLNVICTCFLKVFLLSKPVFV